MHQLPLTGRDVVRHAVRRAAANKSCALEWLRRDEFGSWERTGNEWLEMTAAQRAERGISDEAALDELADRMILLALHALLQDQLKNGSAEKPKRRRAKRAS